MSFRNKIQQTATELMKAHDIPGLAFGIARDKEMLFADGFGMANLEHQVPCTVDSVFEIASITKLFTAEAIMQLLEQGQLDLTDSLAARMHGVAWLPDHWKTITIQQLLVHQSGIPSYTSAEGYWEGMKHDRTRLETLQLVRDLPLKFDPGTQYAYDNTAYYLLGELIALLTGKFYSDVLHEGIFEPLEMKHTRANDYDAIISQRVAGYTRAETDDVPQLRNKPYYSLNNTFSAGILLSTVPDLLKFCMSLYDGITVTPEIRARMLTPYPSQQQNERKFNFSMGLGWFLVDNADNARTFAGHNGGIMGFSSCLIHYPDDRTSIVMLCNQDTVTEPHVVAHHLAEAVLSG